MHFSEDKRVKDIPLIKGVLQKDSFGRSLLGQWLIKFSSKLF